MGFSFWSDDDTTQHNTQQQRPLALRGDQAEKRGNDTVPVTETLSKHRSSLFT